MKKIEKEINIRFTNSLVKPNYTFVQYYNILNFNLIRAKKYSKEDYEKRDEDGEIVYAMLSEST